MKKAIAAMLISTLLWVGCEGGDPWSETCKLYSDYAEMEMCENVEEPKIVYEKMRQGLMGYYDGGDTIYVNEELKGKDRFATILHEMVHYIDAAHGLPVPGPASLICKSEDTAWFLEGVWWGLQGQPDKARPDWWKSYPHCWQWYAPQQFELSTAEYLEYIRWQLGDDAIIQITFQ